MYARKTDPAVGQNDAVPDNLYPFFVAGIKRYYPILMGPVCIDVAVVKTSPARPDPFLDRYSHIAITPLHVYIPRAGLHTLITFRLLTQFS